MGAAAVVLAQGAEHFFRAILLPEREYAVDENNADDRDAVRTVSWCVERTLRASRVRA